MAAGTDLLCFGRDAAEDSYLAVRRALSEAVASGRLPARAAGGGPAERGPAARTGWPAGRAGRRDGADGHRPGRPRWAGTARGPGDHIGLVAARRAVRVSSISTGRPPARWPTRWWWNWRAQENIAVGDVPWGLRPWVPAESVQRVPASLAASEAAAVTEAALARAAGRPLIVVVRDAHRYPAVRAVVSELTAARPDTVVLEMGLPLWVPPAGVHLATYGAARANAQAAAEVLGLAR